MGSRRVGGGRRGSWGCFWLIDGSTHGRLSRRSELGTRPISLSNVEQMTELPVAAVLDERERGDGGGGDGIERWREEIEVPVLLDCFQHSNSLVRDEVLQKLDQFGPMHQRLSAHRLRRLLGQLQTPPDDVEGGAFLAGRPVRLAHRDVHPSDHGHPLLQRDGADLDVARRGDHRGREVDRRCFRHGEGDRADRVDRKRKTEVFLRRPLRRPLRRLFRRLFRRALCRLPWSVPRRLLRRFLWSVLRRFSRRVVRRWFGSW